MIGNESLLKNMIANERERERRKVDSMMFVLWFKWGS